MNTNDKFILDASGNPIPEPDLITWGKWMQTGNRKVKVAQVGESKVSTVFLGLDHNWGDGPPTLWETMVFGGLMDQELDRCSGSREQAEAMHERMVEKVRQWPCTKP